MLRVKEYVVLFEQSAVNSEITTDSINLMNTELYGFNIVWSNGATLNASAQLQVSVDGVNFANAGSPSALSGASGVIILDESDYCYRYSRIKLNFVAGSADIKIEFLTKGRV
jgi:hypothetical protein